MEEFARGKRSVVYRDGNKIIKRESLKSNAINRIDNEVIWLRKLNKQGIGPRLLDHKEGEITMEIVKGAQIMKWLETSHKKEMIIVLMDILKQCRILDEMHVNKYEMTNPYKHIIIMKKKPIMIDFERCKYTRNPKNVTQFCQFLMRGKVKNILERNGIKIDRTLLKNALIDYKKEQDDDNFFRVISCINY